jgi:hypothetical protein
MGQHSNFRLIISNALSLDLADPVESLLCVFLLNPDILREQGRARAHMQPELSNTGL